MKNRCLLAAVVALGVAAVASGAPRPLVFDSPAENDRGAMILGNGELGALAWVSADGTLHTVLQNSDSWNEGGRHVKTGAIDYATGRPVDEGTFRQELSLARGEFEASWRSGGKAVSLRYRVQKGTDSIAVCDVQGAPDAEAKVVNWRLYPGGSRDFGCSWKELGNQFDRVKIDGKPLRFTISADRIVPGGWCHVNSNDTVAKMMRLYDRYQATGDLGKPDLLSDRVFGGLTRKQRDGGRVLFLSAVTCLHPCKDEAEWRRRTEAMLEREGWGIDGETERRAAHVAAWAALWNRSHIEVAQSRAELRSAPKFQFPYSAKLPVSIGRDSRGGTVFEGRLDVDPKSRIDRDGLFLSAKFNTKNSKLNQRIIDNITPGGADGSLVDVLNGRLRLLVGTKWVCHPSRVPSGRDVSVAVSVSRRGEVAMTLNGKEFKTELVADAASRKACAAVTRAYACQRYVTLCAGTGRLPIRFNGSIFTASHDGDPDYRRWGHGYWWQNTRLPYFPLFASGDLDVFAPLFEVYGGLAEFHAKRTRKYLGHGGAYFPECMQPWGDHFAYVYGAECAWKDRKDMLQAGPYGGYHKYEWVGQLELALMMIDWRDHTLDDEWFRTKAIGAIREYVRYFDEHYKTGADGRYVMNPAQALETWWDCTNPMPEVAGLARVTDRLLALPKGVLSADDVALFSRIRSRVPELPTRVLSGGTKAYAPAAKFRSKRNQEHPELYCVFPFRLCSFEKPNAALGRAAYAVRVDRKYRGWKQEELFAAYLGMADEAAEHLVGRVLRNSADGFRWPAFWGPNFDWIPDQCDGGNIQNILQSMLMQYEGGKIYLLPAWPRSWNCSFRLHAPSRTVVEGRVEDGEVKDLVVTPASRRADVVVCR
jgi:hypothetical protein